MSHRFNPRRLVWFALVGMLSTYLLCTAALLLGLLWTRPSWWFRFATRTDLLGEAAAPILTDPDGSWPREPRVVQPLALIAIGLWLVMPLIFLLIPVTLRAARVRRAHLARIWAYSLVSLPLVMAIPSLARLLFEAACRLMERFGLPSDPLAQWNDVFERSRHWSSPAITAAWVWFWWSSAAGLYLRLDRPKFVAFLMVVVAVLDTAVGLSLVYPGGTWIVYNIERP